MADINVLMMGGRRAGKTSVLAAMDQCCDKTLSFVKQLKVRFIDGGASLILKQNELNNYFTPNYMKSMMFTADNNPSPWGSDTYTYEVNVNGRDSGYTLNFMDFSGEWFRALDKDENERDQEEKEAVEELLRMVNMSQIIMITIDTPHMVESIEESTGVGKYHAEFNRVSKITNFLRCAFQESKEERLILFVPLKCEKYYYRKKMNLVNETLKKGYLDLFNFLANDEIEEICTVGIIPILTIGGAEFLKFNSNGYAGMYSYVEDLSLRKYNPQYCEQPLLLALLYLIKMAERNKTQQHKISRWFRETFKNAAKLADLVACKETIEKLIKTDKDKGFEIIQNPLGMEIK